MLNVLALLARLTTSGWVALANDAFYLNGSALFCCMHGVL
jgi:hypothetical protein